ncbi:MAG: shikimate kinase [Thermoproteota archaeon]
MRGEAEAVSNGAATIINAIATGKGAAVGVDLKTKARVKLTDEPGIIKGKIMSAPSEDPVLIEKTVNKILQHFDYHQRFGAKVETWSEIPIAKGLKSSSAAGNAIALATIAALGKAMDDLSIIKMGVEGAMDAGVTITGAFDDACASYLGGVVVTDNLEKRVVKRFYPPQDLSVLFYVPEKKEYTVGSNVSRMKKLQPLVKIAYKRAYEGDYWTALTLNGLIYSSALGYDPSIAVDALMAGASAAGLTGTGPSVATVVSSENKDLVKEALQAYAGEILESRINLKKAEVVS